MKLDKEEKELLKSYENDEWNSVNVLKKKKLDYQRFAKNISVNTKKINTLLLVLLLFCSFAIPSLSKTPDKAKILYYKTIFANKCLDDKITDNFGNGFDSLYGTRNMRVVLDGIAYRGGANNFYHKTNKRDNNNPLPPDGLQHLANLGFSACYYLYSTNFSSAGKEITGSKGNILYYYSNTLPDEKSVSSIIQYVYGVIYDSTRGPVYLHCWNGWHQSGLISALLLRQFCRFSADKAVSYWIENTDGNNKGYDHIKNRIRNFVPIKEFEVDEETRGLICPCEKNGR